MILLVNRSRKDGRALADAFRYMGILARAETPSRATGEISTFYRLVIITDPHTLPDEREYVKLIRSYLSTVPIMALTDRPLCDPSIYDVVAEKSSTAAKIYKSIREYFATSRKYPPGEYLLLGLDASASAGFVTNYSVVIPTTKTQSMILRALIRAYPISLSPKDILKYAFSESKLPDPTSIRTHICAINKKFEKRFERRLIVSIDGGYTLLTPDLADRRHLDFDYHKELKWLM